MPWNNMRLSRNLNITIEDVLRDHDIQWIFRYLSENPNITFKDIIRNAQLPWSFQALSGHRFGYESGKDMIKSAMKR